MPELCDKCMLLSNGWVCDNLSCNNYVEDFYAKHITILKKKYPVDIEELNLSYTRIRKISFLSNLTNLKRLYLNNTQVKDISALGNLTNLKELDLYKTKVQDISALNSLTNLKTLYLSNTKVQKTDIDNLQKTLPNLRIWR
jgi:Leucine-rich repeat (LRR) protein